VGNIAGSKVRKSVRYRCVSSGASCKLLLISACYLVISRDNNLKVQETVAVSSGQIATSRGISPIVSNDSGGARQCTRKRVFWSARDYILRCWRKKLLIKALNCTFLMQRGIPRRELTVISSSRHRSRGLVCVLLSCITHADTPRMMHNAVASELL